MYLDRHSLALLMAYSAAEDPHDELELRRWLSVLVDRATVQGREEFAAAVANTNYPTSAVTPVAPAPGDVQLAIDRAPPALLLMLHEDVHPDNTDARNHVPEDIVESLKRALATWDTQWLERAATEAGWAQPPAVEEPPLEPEPVPQDTTPIPLPPSPEPDATPEPEPVPPPSDTTSQQPTDESSDKTTFTVDRRVVYGGAAALGALVVGYLAWKKLQT